MIEIHVLIAKLKSIKLLTHSVFKKRQVTVHHLLSNDRLQIIMNMFFDVCIKFGVVAGFRKAVSVRLESMSHPKYMSVIKFWTTLKKSICFN